MLEEEAEHLARGVRALADRCRTRRCRPTRRARPYGRPTARRGCPPPRRRGRCGGRHARPAPGRAPPSSAGPRPRAAWATTRSPLPGWTVVSRSPWKTIVGTGRPTGTGEAPPATLAHGGEGRGHVARGPHRQAGMDADRRVEVGIGRPHDRRRRPAGREPGDVDAPRVDRVLAHDLAGDAGDQRGLAPVAPLVGGAEPVPAALHVRRRVLRRIDDEAGALLGERVHPRAGREVVGRLGAAVQHDDQRARARPCSRSGRRACSRASRRRRRRSRPSSGRRRAPRPASAPASPSPRRRRYRRRRARTCRRGRAGPPASASRRRAPRPAPASPDPRRRRWP